MRWLASGIGVALLVGCLATVNAQTTKTITMWDACDPDSFNMAAQSTICIAGHHGTTLFEDFIAELTTDKIAGAWRFNPLVNATEGHFHLARLDLKEGEPITIYNAGGETHTFTRVERFAGGFIAPLNVLSGNLDPAPECAKVLPDSTLAQQDESDTNQFVEAGTTEAGPTAGTSALPLGVSHWECCIHPWMRINIVVHEHEHAP